MRYAPLVVALVSAIALGACAEKDPVPMATPPPASTWEGPPQPDASGTIAVDSWGEYVETADPRLSRSPVRSAVEFVNLGEPSALTTSVVMEQPSLEGGDEATVTVTEDGLLDDSVRAVRYTLRFEREGQAWPLAEAIVEQRCQPGRGHQGFSPEPCV